MRRGPDEGLLFQGLVAAVKGTKMHTSGFVMKWVVGAKACFCRQFDVGDVVVTLRHQVTVPVRYRQERFSPPPVDPCLVGTLQ
jgi:hypothetical protein